MERLGGTMPLAKSVRNHWGKAAAIITTIAGIFGAVWAFEDRYANEKLVAQSLEGVIRQQKQIENEQKTASKENYVSLLKSKLAFYIALQDHLEASIDYYEKYVHKNPDDVDAKVHLRRTRAAKLDADAQILALQMELDRARHD
jgi:hypothetical protein